MKIAILNRSDERGGAAIVTARLADALRRSGHEVDMLVVEKSGDDSHTHTVAGKRRSFIPFLIERGRIFLSTRFNRETLFKLDTAQEGLPLWRNPYIKEADAILINWVNQGMLSMKGFRRLLKLGKPVIVTMHDMWGFTGICHHSGECSNYEKECGNCPLLGKLASPGDLSHKIWLRKKRLYAGAERGQLVFVAVSRWLASRARKSGLLCDQQVEVIPNLFDLSISAPKIESRESDEIRILFGAARIDDPVKDHKTMIATLNYLWEAYPEIAGRLHLITFGAIKTPDSLTGLKVRHTHMGSVRPEELPDLYASGDIILSTSLYETLPGTLVEGEAYGAIPVALDHGGQSDIIDHLQTGYLAPWSDDAEERSRNLAEGLKWAIGKTGDPEIYRRMKQKVEESFAPGKIVAEYDKLMRKDK